MNPPFVPLKQLVTNILHAQGKKGLLLQKLFWGILIGCFSTSILVDSPYLENLESHMLKWRYKMANNHIWQKHEHLENKAKDVSLVTFDDSSQFELGIARFNDVPAQQILAKAIENIENLSPKIIVLDLDLRGANSMALANVFKHYHNIVLALFGNLEGSLPAPVYITNAAAFGYDDLESESDGQVRRLPINYRMISPDSSKEAQSVVAVPSLTEAVLSQLQTSDLSKQYSSLKKLGPLYFGFREKKYDSISLVKVLKQNISSKLVSNKIVILGNLLTPRQQEPNIASNSPAKIYLHANAISTLLENEQIHTLSPRLAKVLILLTGTLFCSIASVLNYLPRTCLFIMSIAVLLLISQTTFESLHIIIPTASPLAALLMSYVTGTFINLNSNLRLRNKELAKARESMQIRAEEERQRIAEDLHDETLPNLSAVARMADKLTKELKDNSIPQQMRERLDFAINEMRRVINDLHPSVLETMGFKPAIENLLVTLKRDSNIQCLFIDADHGEVGALSKLQKLQLYRMIQECLNNIAKHAEAKNVEINMSVLENKLVFSITDDGIGMSPNPAKKESHGILNIKQRAQMIGAKVEWQRSSKYRSGTEVRIELPLNKARGEN
jgi:signal transduction histidine kinase